MNQIPSTLTLRPQQRDVLRQALADAVHYRDPLIPCPLCPTPDNLCDQCATGLFSARAYLALSRTLGLAPPE